jgi:2-polyprenyl-6-methoxyphenol hydroxylase-like FAD-dependent oxidoreductase
MNAEFDAIVVGARIAGSITATLLGEYGHSVLLLDRAHFPSDTLSTHFFRYPALKAFQRAGVFDRVQAAAPHMSNTFTDIESHTWSEPVEGEDGLDYMICLRRITLDAILAERVQEVRHIKFSQGSRLTDLLRSGNTVIGAKWTDRSGNHENSARVIVGADGFYSKVAECVRPEMEAVEPVHRAMYFTYFQGFPRGETSAAEFYFRGDHLVYVFPTDKELTLIAISVPIAEFERYRKDAEGEMMSMLTNLPLLAPRLAAARRAAPVKGAGNIPCYQRIPYGAGWVLVGDSGQVFDPWSGQGIDHASQHAVLLADLLHQYLQNQKTWQDAMSEYHTLRNSSSKKNFESTRRFSRDLRPMARGALRNRGLL